MKPLQKVSQALLNVASQTFGSRSRLIVFGLSLGGNAPADTKPDVANIGNRVDHLLGMMGWGIHALNSKALKVFAEELNTEALPRLIQLLQSTNDFDFQVVRLAIASIGTTETGRECVKAELKKIVDNLPEGIDIDSGGPKGSIEENARRANSILRILDNLQQRVEVA